MQVRKRIGKLSDLRVQPNTLKSYHKALDSFLRWLGACKLTMTQHYEDVDGVLQDFAEECWESGDPRSMVGYALSALTHEIPDLRGRLKGTWSLSNVGSSMSSLPEPLC